MYQHKHSNTRISIDEQTFENRITVNHIVLTNQPFAKKNKSIVTYEKKKKALKFHFHVEQLEPRRPTWKGDFKM